MRPPIAIESLGCPMTLRIVRMAYPGRGRVGVGLETNSSGWRVTDRTFPVADPSLSSCDVCGSRFVTGMQGSRKAKDSCLIAGLSRCAGCG